VQKLGQLNRDGGEDQDGQGWPHSSVGCAGDAGGLYENRCSQGLLFRTCGNSSGIGNDDANDINNASKSSSGSGSGSVSVSGSGNSSSSGGSGGGWSAGAGCLFSVLLWPLSGAPGHLAWCDNGASISATTSHNSSVRKGLDTAEPGPDPAAALQPHHTHETESSFVDCA
jgi:hypothetical protein